ncbi:DUF305 domain-containing protein [Thalassobaculum sp. OXR-137]|uniref:DUF305 domain-containing protein n=1 Tax=Thalassobaculum sp. OXR-137 TaxID=3100173 RepID=UPI002AC975FD|nr:DUF305 domain-containing protein [Thalassobaculum sp. OXR-137]WPZ34566.1 DUF305 domain-containing protein [Thalassobaculum sp. OXR-137]
MKYGQFFLMILTSTVVMFGLMYLNTYLPTHIFWSETRAYMAILMGATMAIVMLAFMLSMYPSTKVNSAIFVGALVLFAGSLWLVRSQVTVDDRSYMRAMIPHHSIAIMTSTRAGLSDPRVRKLADEIIYAQDKEIAEMRYLISAIEQSGDSAAVGDQPANTDLSIATLDEALSTAEIGVLDPEFISENEIAQAFADGAGCTFHYTQDSKPVLAIGEQDDGRSAILKISGDLVRLSEAGSAGRAAGSTLSAPGISLQITGRRGETLSGEQDAAGAEADLLLEVDRGLEAGYSGFYRCGT